MRKSETDGPVATWYKDDGTCVVWLGGEQGECLNGREACAMFDVYPRSEKHHCGCKEKRSPKALIESEAIIGCLELILEGKASIDDIAAGMNESPEEIQRFLHSLDK